MTILERDTLFEEFTTSAKAIMDKKNDSYGAGEDILSNFKNIGSIVGTDAKASVLHLIATKVARLGSLLIKDRQSDFESAEDSVLDLFNYTFILKCILNENIVKKSSEVEINDQARCQEEINKGLSEPQGTFEERKKLVDELLSNYRFGVARTSY